jgi:hypothetical protein
MKSIHLALLMRVLLNTFPVKLMKMQSRNTGKDYYNNYYYYYYYCSY